MDDMDYFDIYGRISPSVERYLNRYIRYPWQGMPEREEIERMVDDIYGEVGERYPEMMSVQGKNARPSQAPGGLLRTMTGLVLLGGLYGRYPSYYPGYGGYGPPMPGYGYGPGVPIYPGEGGTPIY